MSSNKPEISCEEPAYVHLLEAYGDLGLTPAETSQRLLILSWLIPWYSTRQNSAIPEAVINLHAAKQYTKRPLEFRLPPPVYQSQIEKNVSELLKTAPLHEFVEELRRDTHPSLLSENGQSRTTSVAGIVMVVNEVEHGTLIVLLEKGGVRCTCDTLTELATKLYSDTQATYP